MSGPEHQGSTMNLKEAKEGIEGGGEMPPPGSAGVRRSGSGRGPGKGPLNNRRSDSSLNSSDGSVQWSEFKRRPRGSRRTPQSTAEMGEASLVDLQEDEESEWPGDPEVELHHQLQDVLRECSRQRLRAVQMGLRRCANIESRVTSKELSTVFQDNQVKISSRAFQMLVELFEDSLGVDYERMWRSLVVAQGKTGRDSVLAQNKRNDERSRRRLPQEQRDADLVSRLEKQIIKGQGPKDLSKLRTELQARDKNKTGRIKGDQVMEVFNETQMPVYGALLTCLINRCDEDNTGDVSWPEVMSFLDKAHGRVDPTLLRSDTSSSLMSRPPTGSQTSRPGAAGTGTGTEDGKAGILDSEITPALAKPKVKHAYKKVKMLENPEEKPSAISKFKKAGGSVANTSGFLSSMKTLLSGKKKGDEADIPVIQVDKHPEVIPEASETSGSPPMSRSATPRVPSPRPDSAVSPSPNMGSYSNLNTQTSDSSLQLQTSPRPGSGGGGIYSGTSAKKGKSTTVTIQGKKLKLYPPDNFQDSSGSTDPPPQRLQLGWVYGYRGNDCRSNLWNLASGEVVYFTGTVAVLYDRDSHSQRHYKEHTQEIRSMAVHPNGYTVATGQGVFKGDADGQASIRMWRSDTLQTLHILGTDFFTKAVICLAFSKTKDSEENDFLNRYDGPPKERLAAVDASEGHTLSVWDVPTGKIIAHTNLGVEVMCDVNFNPTSPNLLVSVGKEHLAWWDVLSDQQALDMRAKPEYGNFLRAKYVICAAHTERGDLLTGDSNGTVYVWGNSGNQITNFIKHGHDGPVFSMLFTRGHLITAGRDGMVYGWIWSKNMDKSGKIQLPSHEGGVRTLLLHRDLLLMGTTTNSILMAKLAPVALRNPISGVELNRMPLTQGHFDSVFGIAVLRGTEQTSHVLTVGSDGILSLIDTNKKQPVWKHMLKNIPLYCVDVSRDGNTLVLGSKDSSGPLHVFCCSVLVLKLAVDEGGVSQMAELSRVKLGQNRIQHVRLAPDNATIAVGDAGGVVHIVTWQEEEKGKGNFQWGLLGTCQGHKGAITGLDWSAETYNDTYILRSNSKDLELLFWNGTTLVRMDPATEIRNLQWASNSCLITFTISGIWQSHQAQKAEINTVDVSLQHNLVAMGDNTGNISLFRHPCTKKGVEYNSFPTYHPSVHNLSFLPDDRHLVSVGGPDSTILQWHLV